LIGVKGVALSPSWSRRRRTEVDTMTSPKKIEANRQNAQKSTGPRTATGKDAVRLNAMRHGLLSKEILLPGEDVEALQELDERLRIQLRPVGELENLLVDQITNAYWRLARLGRIETGIFVWEHHEELAQRAEQEARQYETSDPGFFGPETEITDDEKHEEALERARNIRSEQADEIATLGRTFARDADGANAFTKLSRYETAIERRLFRALHELERRQAIRLGGTVQPPHVVDVEISGIPEGGS
jgi:hypothetical protein